MWLYNLIACVAQATSPAEAPNTAAPVNWYYAGGAIDPTTLAFVGPDVTFHTVGDDLRTGPVGGAGWLTCGDATRATLVFEEGALREVVTIPDAPCVAEAAQALDWSALPLDGARLDAEPRAVLVFDVPAVLEGAP